jgi:hypothetical protein
MGKKKVCFCFFLLETLWSGFCLLPKLVLKNITAKNNGYQKKLREFKKYKYLKK